MADLYLRENHILKQFYQLNTRKDININIINNNNNNNNFTLHTM